MRRTLVTSILFISLTLNVFSQEVKVKKDIVTVDGVSVFKLVSTNYPDAYTIYNLNDEKLAVFNALFYNDPKQITPGSPEGRIGYFDITFFNEAMDKCEIRIVGFKKQLAELIVSEKLVKDGKLDNTAVMQFCRVNGTKFSEDQKRSNTTIIINH
jgi:hypothetical protein